MYNSITISYYNAQQALVRFGVTNKNAWTLVKRACASYDDTMAKFY